MSVKTDSYGRSVDYLRISITDRCNERCLYCRPEGYRGWQALDDALSDDEIVAIVRVAASLGFRKLRLTGGEPLIRPGVVDLARRLWEIHGIEAFGVSTNGTHLASLAVGLRQAGLRSVNVSLDTLDPALYRQITGGDLGKVLEGIDAAIAAGFERVKINCVLMRGINEGEIWPLTQFAAKHALPLRLIELMPLTRTDVLTEANFFPVGDAIRLLSTRDQLVPAPEARLGQGPARYYRLEQTGALIGFIGALTNLCFCDHCNKLRLTADGKLRPCLGQHAEVDLLPALRPRLDLDALRAGLQQAIDGKPREHGFRDQYQPLRPMTAIGG